MTKRLSSFLFLISLLGYFQSGFAQSGQFKWVRGAATANGIINSVAYSNNGDFVYVGGNLDGNPGVSYPIVVSGANGQDGYVAKYTSSGTLVWIFTIGGNNLDNVTAVAVDGNDNVIVGGTFEGNGVNFKGTSGSSSILNSVGGSDIFIAKYNSNGVLDWLRQGASSQTDLLNDIAVDNSNNIYVAGASSGPFNYNGNPISNNGGREAFGIKLLNNGTFAWINSVGSTGTDEMTSVTVFGGKAYFGGYFDGLQLANLSGTLIGVLNLTAGTDEMFINKYDAVTGNYEATSIFGGTSDDRIKSLSNNGSNVVFTASSTGSLTIGSTSYSNINTEIVTAIVDVNFNPIWSHSTSHTVSGYADPGGVNCLPNGNTVVTGRYTGTLATGLAPNLTSDNQDGVVIIYNGAGSVVSRTKFYGDQSELGSSVAVKNSQTFFIGGQYEEDAVFPNYLVQGNSGVKHPFVAAMGCVEDTAELSLSGSGVICAGQTTNLLVTFVGTGPYSGTISNGSLNYTFTNVSGPTHTITVTPSTGTSNFSITSFSSSGCGQITVGSVSIIVHPPITNNIIFSDTTICYNHIPSFTGTVPVGGDGSAPVYQWQYNLFGSWLPGNNVNTLQNYTSIQLVANRTFRRAVTINGCPTNYSNEVDVTVLANLGGNSISSAQTICNGTTPSGLTGGNGSGGTGSYTYQWQSSPDQLVWTNHVTTQNYSPPSLTSNRYYRRILFSGVCDSDTSNTILITVLPPITNNIISSDVTHCGTSATSFTGTVPVGATGGAPSYLWQYSINGGVSWNNGMNTNNLQNYTSTPDNNTTLYRRRVTIGSCPAVFSNILTVTILPSVGNNSISLGTTTFCGPINPGTITGSAPTGGNGTFNYIWESSTNNVVWTNVGTSANYSPGVLSNSTYFRRRVNSGGCGQYNTSNVIFITIQNVLSNNTISADEFLCQGVSPATIVGSVPTGGNGTYNYVWRSSTDNVNFVNVSPAVNSINFSPPTQTSTYYYKRVVTSGFCSPDTSTSVQKLVYPAISNNTISAPQTICENSLATPLIGTIPTGGDGSTPIYLWEQSLDNASFSPASGVNDSIHYEPGILSSTTYYRRRVIRGICPSSFSDTVQITVQPSLANNIISADEFLCQGASPATIVGSIPTGGNGTYNYVWQSSTDNVNFVNVFPAVNSINFSPPTLTSTFYYRRVVTSGFCSPDTSATVQKLVYPTISNNTISAPQTICENSLTTPLNGSIPTGGDGSTPIYLWEQSTDNTNFSPAVGVNDSIHYEPGILLTTTYYRRRVNRGICPSSFSDTIQITVQPALANNIISADQILCGTSVADTLFGSLPTGGNGIYLYNWDISFDSLVWTELPSYLQNYSPGLVSQSAYYRRRINAGACTNFNFSNVLTLTVLPEIANNTIASNQINCSGNESDTIIGTIATANFPVAYAWEQSVDSITWISANGVVLGTNFWPNILTQTTHFRRIASSNFCPSDTSNFVTFTIEDSISNNLLTITQSTICSTDTTAIIDGSVPTNGNGNYTYNWEKSSDGISWFPSIGNFEDLALGGINQSTYFRRIVTSGFCASDTSAALLVTVSPFITTNDISASAQTICYNSIPNPLTGLVQTPGTFSFLWLESNDDVNFFPGSFANNLANYAPGNLIQNTFYKRIIKSGACPNDTSSSVQISIVPDIFNNTIVGDTTVCFGSTNISFIGSTVSGGNGSYTYLWETSTDGVNFSTALAPSNLANYTLSLAIQTRYFRRVVFSDFCPDDSLISNVVIVTVQDAVTNNIISANQTICGSTIPNTLDGLAIAGGNGIPVYQWQSSLDLVSWTNVGTNEDFSPGSLLDTTYFRRTAVSGVCLNTNFSNVVTINVQQVLSGTSISQNDTICTGAIPNTLSSVGTIGGDNQNYTYAWQQNNGTGWTSAVGLNLSILFIPSALTDTTDYRLIVASTGCPSDTSNSVTVIVEDSIGNNSIVGPGTICSSNVNDSIFGTLPQNGDGTYNYQWESSADGLNWSLIIGATGQDYAIGSISTPTYFRRQVISGECGYDISDSVLVNVDAEITTNVIGQNQTICYNALPNELIGNSSSILGFSYEWQVSTDSLTFVGITGSNTPNYQPGNLTQTTYFRRIIYSGVCQSDTSNVVTIIVYDFISNNILPADTSVCYNEPAVFISGSTPTGGNGSYGYDWMQSVDGITFSAMGISSADLTVNNLQQSTYFVRNVTSSACPNEVISDTIFISVYTQITGEISAQSDSICLGESIQPTISFTGDFPLSFGFSYDGQSQSISNQTLSDYNFNFNPDLNGTIYLDSIVDVHGCVIHNVDSLKYAVFTYPVISLGNDTTVCDGLTFVPIVGSGSLNFTSPTLGSLSTVFPLVYQTNTFGSHDFILSETNVVCTTYDTMNVTFTEPVSNIYAGEDLFIEIKDSIFLEASALLSNQTGVWTIVSGSATIVDSLSPNSVLNDLISGVVVLEWTVSNAYCPSVSDQVRIDIRNLLVPTGFSPNNDGVNDYFVIAGREDLEDIQVQIFDRWGGLIYENDDYQNDWGGTSSSGEDLPEDTYFLIVDFGERGTHKSYLIIRR